jgi:hypothetical protein
MCYIIEADFPAMHSLASGPIDNRTFLTCISYSMVRLAIGPTSYFLFSYEQGYSLQCFTLLALTGLVTTLSFIVRHGKYPIPSIKKC